MLKAEYQSGDNSLEDVKRIDTFYLKKVFGQK